MTNNYSLTLILLIICQTAFSQGFVKDAFKYKVTYKLNYQPNKERSEERRVGKECER